MMQGLMQYIMVLSLVCALSEEPSPEPSVFATKKVVWNDLAILPHFLHHFGHNRKGEFEYWEREKTNGFSELKEIPNQKKDTIRLKIWDAVIYVRELEDRKVGILVFPLRKRAERKAFVVHKGKNKLHIDGGGQDARDAYTAMMPRRRTYKRVYIGSPLVEQMAPNGARGARLFIVADDDKSQTFLTEALRDSQIVIDLNGGSGGKIYSRGGTFAGKQGDRGELYFYINRGLPRAVAPHGIAPYAR